MNIELMLVRSKHEYKKYECKVKRLYKRHEGDMLQYLRKNIPSISLSYSQRKRIKA